MARGELARFAVGRLGIAAGHSIDRREVAALFQDRAEPDSAAFEFFGQFAAIYSFFAADDASFRRALSATTRGAVSFQRFRPDGDGHIGRLYLESVDPLDVSIDSRIDLLPADLAAADRLIGQLGVAQHKFVLLFPGSGSATKNWPLDRFIDLARETSSLMKPIVVLGPAETGIGGHFRKARIETLEDLDLPTVAALANRAGAFVGNDSGVSHLAAAAGCGGIVIFGPSDPARWHPLGDVTILRREPIEALPTAEVLNILRGRLVSP